MWGLPVALALAHRGLLIMYELSACLLGRVWRMFGRSDGAVVSEDL